MADRSVSINLRARVSGFVAGMREAKGETQNLSRQMTETGASADRMRQRLEAATRALPKIQIDADSTAAEVKFAQLRSQMDSLADKKIGIDVSAADAMAQIREIERELEQLQRNEADINVKADIGAALAELRAVDAEVSRVNGKDANVQVNADVRGALTSIALVGAALASLPAVTTIAVGVTALGSAFAAAGVGAAAFSAVAVPGFKRVSEALKAQESAAQSAGSATGGAGRSAADAAQQAAALEQAEKRLKDAHLEEKQAQEDLTRAREAGRRALEDMNFSMERSILSQKDAALAAREAEARLADLQRDPKATALEIERAQLSLEQAQQRSREQEVKTQRARKDTAEANREGVKGTKEYQQALDRLKQAQDKVSQAEQQLKQLHQQQAQAMSGGGGVANKVKDAFAGLSKQERELAKDLKSFQDAYVAWQRSLEPQVFGVISQGLGLMQSSLPKLTPLVQSSSAAFQVLLRDAEKALAGPFWNTFLYNVNTQIPGAIVGLGRSFGNIATGVAGILDAFLPFTPTIVGGVEKASKAFSEWGQNLKNSPEFHEFIAYVKENAPQVWDLIKNVASALGNIAKAAAPLGVGAFSGLNLLAQIVSGMDPEHIRGIALAIGAIKLATLGMGAVKSWQNFAGGIELAGASAGKASGKMAALGKAAIGVSAAVVGFEATGSILSELGGQSEGVDKLTLALTELGQSGKWAGDLGNQWGGAFDDASKAARLFGDGLRELQDPSFGEMYWLHPLSEILAILPGIDSEVDRLEQKFTDLDTALAGMVQSGNADMAAKAFDQLAQQAAKQGIPVEKLKELLPTYSQAVRVAGTASAEAAAGVDQAKQQMDGFNQSLSTFAGRTDALQALQSMKSAYNEAEKAIEAASGKLDVNARMTDKQRDAVIQAREKFGAYIESVRSAADGAKTLGDNTLAGTRAVLEQLPQLGALAGKNKEAREQIILLAQAYGISREDAIKAMNGAKDFKEVLDKLKSKEVEIKLKTEEARKQFHDLVQEWLNIKPVEIPVGIKAPTKSPKPKAAGGIQTTSGVDLMAAGGVRGSSSMSPPPNITDKATLIAGSNTVYAEAGREAYIPYASQYRGRAIGIMSQVADDFGLQLGGKTSSPMMTSGPVNSSRVSAPQQVSAPRMVTSAPSASGGGSVPGSGSAGRSGGGLVTIQGDLVVRERADADLVASYLSARIDSKGF
ncbi:hypothetical protein ABT294_00555 [Nonomuraea sp. NPDC000554]|uniref:hypothetical protein n=1 Tax=Nonomuraea sp. NPDC000554 TaxID=3154259 RepID=UPI00331EFE29